MACEVGAPQVNYRESISRVADVKYIHKKQSGGSGQFADVSIKFEPGEPGSGFEFRSEIKGGVVGLLLWQQSLFVVANLCPAPIKLQCVYIYPM